MSTELASFGYCLRITQRAALLGCLALAVALIIFLASGWFGSFDAQAQAERPSEEIRHAKLASFQQSRQQHWMNLLLAALVLKYPVMTDQSWSATSSLNTARIQHTATLPPNEKVLVAGRQGNSGILNNAELYDGTSQLFPSPSILSVNPDWITNGKGAFTLSVIGTNFVKESLVRWNGNNRPTVYTSLDK